MIDSFLEVRSKFKARTHMISEINEVFSNLSNEKKGKFACGPKFTVADFCIAALYFEIKEEMPELLE